MIENILKTFIILMFLHALADFALQSDAMAKGKNRLTQIEIKEEIPWTYITIKREDLTWLGKRKVKKKYKIDHYKYFEFHEKRLSNGQKFVNCWFYWLSAHALIHGGVIMMVFPEFWYLGLAEMINHFIIDSLKTHKKINIHADQMMHLWWKIVYLIIMVIV